MIVTPVIQCNHVDYEGAIDVSLRVSPDGHPVIEQVIKNAKSLNCQGRATIACPDVDANKVFKKAADRFDIDCYLGEKLNVAARLINAASPSKATHIAWLQGLLFFLDIEFMDQLVDFGKKNRLDYARCVDGTCKHWLGQFVSVGALNRVVEEASRQQEDEAGWNLARPFAYIRKNPERFKIGLFEAIPDYSDERLREMREIARRIHIGGERAEHSGRGSVTGDVSIGRYREIFHEIPEGSAVLDVACGNGYGSALMARRAKQVIGVDISEQVIEKAKNTYNERLEFRVGSATAIPAESNSVDVLVSIATIEHVPDDTSFVREVFRVVKPGGKAIIYTPQNRFGKIPTWPWHEREYSIDELTNLFRNDFRVDAIWGWQNGQVTVNDPRGDGTYLFVVKPVSGSLSNC